MSQAYDFLDITAFPMPLDFEETISGDDLISVEFFTDDFWQSEESIIISGGKLYRQIAGSVERILDVSEFEFYAMVDISIDEYGDVDPDGGYVRTEKHTFTAFIENEEIVKVIFEDYHITNETIPED